MTLFLLYSLTAALLFALGLHGFLFRKNLVRKVLALNISGSGVFLLLVAVAARNRAPDPDPVPHAMVVTGIVVAVSSTALALALIRRFYRETGTVVLPEEREGE